MKTQIMTLQKTTFVHDPELQGYYSMTYNGASDLKSRLAQSSFEKEVAQLLDSNLPKARHVVEAIRQLINQEEFAHVQTPIRIEVQHDFWIQKGPNEQHGALIQITDVKNSRSPKQQQLKAVFM